MSPINLRKGTTENAHTHSLAHGRKKKGYYWKYCDTLYTNGHVRLLTLLAERWKRCEKWDVYHHDQLCVLMYWKQIRDPQKGDHPLLIIAVLTFTPLPLWHHFQICQRSTLVDNHAFHSHFNRGWHIETTKLLNLFFSNQIKFIKNLSWSNSSKASTNACGPWYKTYRSIFNNSPSFSGRARASEYEHFQSFVGHYLLNKKWLALL